MCACVCRKRLLNCRHFKSLILRMRIVSGFVTCAPNKSHLHTVCEESNIMTKFTPPEIWKRHSVQLDIQHRSANRKISACLGANLRTGLLMKTKHPVHIMLFDVATRDGDVMPPFIGPVS